MVDKAILDLQHDGWDLVTAFQRKQLSARYENERDLQPACEFRDGPWIVASPRERSPEQRPSAKGVLSNGRHANPGLP